MLYVVTTLYSVKHNRNIIILKTTTELQTYYLNLSELCISLVELWPSVDCRPLTRSSAWVLVMRNQFIGISILYIRSSYIKCPGNLLLLLCLSSSQYRARTSQLGNSRGLVRERCLYFSVPLFPTSPLSRSWHQLALPVSKYCAELVLLGLRRWVHVDSSGKINFIFIAVLIQNGRQSSLSDANCRTNS